MSLESHPAFHHQTIEFLTAHLAEIEREATAYRGAVNAVCAWNGLPIMFPETAARRLPAVIRAPVNSAITRSRMTAVAPAASPQAGAKAFPAISQTAVRQILARSGPVPPHQIVEELKQAGVQIAAGSEDAALAFLLAMLRKRSGVFRRMSNGSWGLKERTKSARLQAPAGFKSAPGAAARAA